MGINNTRQASKAMAVAFKITSKMVGKSDSRRVEILVTAKKLIDAAENYMLLERMKYSAGIESK
ncbi:MAG: hypothetical protein ACI8ZB_005512 [Desulforhopalus sp.]|jgi:hypothetical protein